MSPLRLPLGIGKRLAMFRRDQAREFIAACLQKIPAANIIRARRCGDVLAHFGNACAAASMAASPSATSASVTCACTSPVAGLNTLSERCNCPVTSRPAI